MVNIKIKNEQFFTIERSEGSLDYPRYYYASKISDYAFDIKSIGAEQTKLLSFALIKSVTIEGVEFTEIHDFISAINGILYNGASGSGSTTAITDKLQELIDLTQSENDQTQELLNNPQIQQNATIPMIANGNLETIIVPFDLDATANYDINIEHNYPQTVLVTSNIDGGNVNVVIENQSGNEVPQNNVIIKLKKII